MRILGVGLEIERVFALYGFRSTPAKIFACDIYVPRDPAAEKPLASFPWPQAIVTIYTTEGGRSGKIELPCPTDRGDPQSKILEGPQREHFLEWAVRELEREGFEVRRGGPKS